MTSLVRCATPLSLLLCSIACTNPDRLTAPSTPPPPAIQPRPGGEWPPLSGPATIYQAVSAAAGTRYVLYENEAFSLQFFGFEYAGVYRREAERISFYFAGDTRWAATGTLKGDLLEVRYNDIMQHSDFENGVYRRSP